MANKTSAKKDDRVMLIILIALLIGGGGYFFYTYFLAGNSGMNNPTPVKNIAPRATGANKNVPVATASPANKEVAEILEIKTGRSNPFLEARTAKSSGNETSRFFTGASSDLSSKMMSQWGFKVLAVGGSPGNYFALLETRAGEMPIVKEGDRIGAYGIRNINLETLVLEKGGRQFFLRWRDEDDEKKS